MNEVRRDAIRLALCADMDCTSLCTVPDVPSPCVRLADTLERDVDWAEVDR